MNMEKWNENVRDMVQVDRYSYSYSKQRRFIRLLISDYIWKRFWSVPCFLTRVGRLISIQVLQQAAAAYTFLRSDGINGKLRAKQKPTQLSAVSALQSQPSIPPPVRHVLLLLAVWVRVRRIQGWQTSTQQPSVCKSQSHICLLGLMAPKLCQKKTATPP